MALKKRIELSNGIPVEYHRISYIQKVTNKCNLIQIESYTAEAKRTEEQDADLSGEESDVYIHKTLIRTEYNADATIQDAYALLKSEGFLEGAEDA